jgi:hypothetical protein
VSGQRHHGLEIRQAGDRAQLRKVTGKTEAVLREAGRGDPSMASARLEVLCGIATLPALPVAEQLANLSY